MRSMRDMGICCFWANRKKLPFGMGNTVAVYLYSSVKGGRTNSSGRFPNVGLAMVTRSDSNR